MIERIVLRLVSAAAVGLALLGAAGSAEAQMKIAVVDTQRAIMETEDGLRAQATLKKLFDSRQRQLDQQQKALQEERADLEKQREVISKQAFQKRVKRWQQEMSRLQSVYVEYNKELQKKQNELTQPIFRKAMGIIRQLATQSGYDVILDKKAAPYVRSDLDLTDKLIRLYNSKAGGAAPEKEASDEQEPSQ